MGAQGLCKPLVGVRSPGGPPSFRSIRLSVRTPGFHPGKRGSTPLCSSNNVPGLCNGSTTDFDSVSLGSIPSPGAK